MFWHAPSYNAPADFRITGAPLPQSWGISCVSYAD